MSTIVGFANKWLRIQGGDRHMASTSVNNVGASSFGSRIPHISRESTSRIDSLSEQPGRSESRPQCDRKKGVKMAPLYTNIQINGVGNDRQLHMRLNLLQGVGNERPTMFFIINRNLLYALLGDLLLFIVQMAILLFTTMAVTYKAMICLIRFQKEYHLLCGKLSQILQHTACSHLYNLSSPLQLYMCLNILQGGETKG